MESRSGSLLAWLEGIILFVFSFMGSFVFFGMGGDLKGAFNPTTSLLPEMLLIGGLLILSSKWMKNPSKVKRGAILSLVLGVLTLPIMLLGILGIIAGIIGLRDAKKQLTQNLP